MKDVERTTKVLVFVIGLLAFLLRKYPAILKEYWEESSNA